MENKNIIIILIIIVVIIAAAVGLVMLNPTSAKEPTQIKITSDKQQYEGGKLSVKLTDLNNTPISKEKVNITVTNSKGKVVVDDVVKTNSKGKASMDLDLKKGKYNVTVNFAGNENYTGNNTTMKLTIKEKVAEAKTTSEDTTQQSSSASSSHTVIGEDGIYYEVDDSGKILETLGPSQKYYPNNPNSVNYPNAESSEHYQIRP